jgi:hypothetical protein
MGFYNQFKSAPPFSGSPGYGYRFTVVGLTASAGGLFWSGECDASTNQTIKFSRVARHEGLIQEILGNRCETYESDKSSASGDYITLLNCDTYEPTERNEWPDYFASYYGTGDGCDCGLGAIDPDCKDAPVVSSGLITSWDQPGCGESGCFEARCDYCFNAYNNSSSCSAFITPLDSSDGARLGNLSDADPKELNVSTSETRPSEFFSYTVGSGVNVFPYTQLTAHGAADLFMTIYDYGTREMLAVVDDVVGLHPQVMLGVWGCGPKCATRDGAWMGFVSGRKLLIRVTPYRPSGRGSYWLASAFTVPKMPEGYKIYGGTHRGMYYVATSSESLSVSNMSPQADYIGLSLYTPGYADKGSDWGTWGEYGAGASAYVQVRMTNGEGMWIYPSSTAPYDQTVWIE